jgi:hypothetical protein
MLKAINEKSKFKSLDEIPNELKLQRSTFPKFRSNSAVLSCQIIPRE